MGCIWKLCSIRREIRMIQETMETVANDVAVFSLSVSNATTNFNTPLESFVIVEDDYN